MPYISLVLFLYLSYTKLLPILLCYAFKQLVKQSVNVQLHVTFFLMMIAVHIMFKPHWVSPAFAR